MLLDKIRLAALALVATAGMASAVTVTDRVSAAGGYAAQDGTAVTAGSVLDVNTPLVVATQGAFSGVSSVDPFSIVFSAAPSSVNAGTAIRFGMFTLTITDTTLASLSGAFLQLAGFGTVTGGSMGAVDGGFFLSSSAFGAPSGAVTLDITVPPDPNIPPASPVPLPAGLPLLLAGLGALAFLRRSRTA